MAPQHTQHRCGKILCLLEVFCYVGSVRHGGDHAVHEGTGHFADADGEKGNGNNWLGGQEC